MKFEEANYIFMFVNKKRVLLPYSHPCHQARREEENSQRILMASDSQMNAGHLHTGEIID